MRTFKRLTAAPFFGVFTFISLFTVLVRDILGFLRKLLDFLDFRTDGLLSSILSKAYQPASLKDLGFSPTQLADPTLLVQANLEDSLVPHGKPCCPSSAWRVSLHFRHAFCTACQEPAPRANKSMAAIFAAAVQNLPSTAEHQAVLRSYQQGTFPWHGSAAFDIPTLLVVVCAPGCYCGCNILPLSPHPRKNKIGKVQPQGSTWAVSLHYRYIFCVSCGKRPADARMVPDIIMVAASQARDYAFANYHHT